MRARFVVLASFLVVLRFDTEAFSTWSFIAVAVDLFFVLVAVVFCLGGVTCFLIFSRLK